MADMRIDDATADTLVTGTELIPASDAGAAKQLTVAQIRDFVMAAVAATDEASTTDISEDGVYIKQSGVTKRLSETVLAQAIMAYAFGLAGIVTPNGNELFIIDDSGTKKTMTLEKLTAYVTANYADVFTSLTSADPMAASDKIVLKQGNSVKYGTLGALATFVQGSLATYLASCVNVLNVQQSDKVVVVSGGVTKTMLVSQFLAALPTAEVPAATTEDKIPQWADDEGTLKDGLSVGTTIRAQGTADNNTIPTEAAVRAAIGQSGLSGPESQTTGNVPQWDSTTGKLTNGKGVVTSVGTTGSDANLPTEKAVRSAITAATSGLPEGDVKAPQLTTENKIPQWDSTQKKLKDGKTVVTTVGSTGTDDNLPTEKAVRDAISAEVTARDAAIAAAVAEVPTGDVVGPQTSTENKVPQWDATNKKLKDGLTVTTSVGATGADTALPTEKAVRSAIAAAITASESGAADGDVKGPTLTTENKVPQWDETQKKLKDGLTVTTSVGATGADTALPTEKAVRSAITAAATAEASARDTAISAATTNLASAPVSTTENKVPQWDATTQKLKDGLTVTTSVGTTGVNTAIPTEKAVRTAIDAKVSAEASARDTAISTAAAGLVSAPVSTTENRIPQWDETSKKLKDGLTVATSVGETGADTAIPTEKAVRTAIAAAITASEAGAAGGDVKGPLLTTENKVPQWDETSKKLKDGLTVTTSVGTTGVNTAIPTEKAVRTAITEAVEAVPTGDVKGPLATTENNVPQWDAATKKLKDGLAVSTSIGDLAVDTKIPTEKAVKTAIAAETTARGTAITTAVEAEAAARDTAIEAAVAAAVSDLEDADTALGARIDGLDAITGPETTTSGKVPQWDSTNRALKDGLTVKTSVGALAQTSDAAIPTEKAVRQAVDARVGAPVSHVEDCIPTWGAANELKSGLAVVTTLASNGSNTNIPTEKAVRDALPVAATTSTAGLMSAADKAKLDGMANTGAVAEIGAALADTDTLVVKQGDSVYKKSLLSRFWTYIMGKLPTYKIDDLAVADDNTDLNASTSRHGLCPKLSGDTTHFLRGDGTFASPEGSDAFTGADGTNAGTKGLVPAPAATDANKFLKADGTWTEPPSAAGVDIPGATAIDAPVDADLVYLFDSSTTGYRKATLAQIREMLFGMKRYDTIFIPAGAMTPTDGNGATPGAVKFVNATHDTMAFPSTADKSVEFSVAMPDDWDMGAVKAKVLWTFYDSTAGQSGQAVRWQLGAVTARDGDDISDAPTAYTNIDDVTQSANELCRTGASAAITAEGTAETGGLLHFTLKRDADYEPTGGTALGTEALALGVVIQFGRTTDFTGW